MKCKECRFLAEHIPEDDGDTGYSFCILLMLRGNEVDRSGRVLASGLDVNSDKDYCSFGEGKCTKNLSQSGG